MELFSKHHLTNDLYVITISNVQIFLQYSVILWSIRFAMRVEGMVNMVEWRYSSTYF